jgi:hypothetical protein
VIPSEARFRPVSRTPGPVPDATPWTHRSQSISSGARNPPEIDRHLGGSIVDDSRCLRFFLEPTDTLHRRYEALRAYFVERRPLKDIVQQSGYSYNTLRDVICDFRAQCREDRVPPFSRHPRSGDRSATARSHRSARRSLPLRIVASWTSPRDDASGPGSPGSSCSCPCWLASASTRSSTTRAIPDRTWCPPPAPC